MPSALPWRLPLIAATAAALACADVETQPSEPAGRGLGSANRSLAVAPTERIVELENGVRVRVEDGDRTEAPFLAFAWTDNLDEPLPARLSLREVLHTATGATPYLCVDAAFGRGTQLELLYRRYEPSLDYRHSREVAGVLVLDAADPRAPSVVGKHEWPLSSGEEATYQWMGAVEGSPGGTHDRRFARLGGRLVALEQSAQWTREGAPTLPKSRLRLVDLSHPNAVTSATLALAPRAYTGLLASGDELWLGYLEQASDAVEGERAYVQPIAIDALGRALLGTAREMKESSEDEEP